jgi:ribosome-binding ATPase YchF (GTP1/OBG family)
MRGAEKEAYEREQVVLTGLKDALENDQLLRDVVPNLDPDDRKILSGFGLLSAKPLLILLNTGESQLGAPSDALVAEARERFGGPNVAVDALSGQIEMEIGRLDAESAEIFMSDLGIQESSLGRIIRISFDLLGLMPFFTVGPDECRAWTVEQGITAVEAAGAIHSDIQRGFIRAEVVGYDDMIAAGTLAQAKALGTFRREGKTYIVQNGDIINFLFNV